MRPLCIIRKAQKRHTHRESPLFFFFSIICIFFLGEDLLCMMGTQISTEGDVRIPISTASMFVDVLTSELALTHLPVLGPVGEKGLVPQYFIGKSSFMNDLLLLYSPISRENHKLQILARYGKVLSKAVW